MNVRSNGIPIDDGTFRKIKSSKVNVQENRNNKHLQTLKC